MDYMNGCVVQWADMFHPASCWLDCVFPSCLPVELKCLVEWQQVLMLKFCRTCSQMSSKRTTYRQTFPGCCNL